MHPCYTCRGSIGGKPDSVAELRKPADPYRLECPDCDDNRHANGRPPIILRLPTNRDRRRAADGSGPAVASIGSMWGSRTRADARAAVGRSQPVRPRQGSPWPHGLRRGRPPAGAPRPASATSGNLRPVLDTVSP